MIAYKCLECGYIFDLNDEKCVEDVDGNRYFGCPICEGVIETITKCECGNYMPEKDLVCESCKKQIESLMEDAFGDLAGAQIEYALDFIERKII